MSCQSLLRMASRSAGSFRSNASYQAVTSFSFMAASLSPAWVLHDPASRHRTANESAVNLSPVDSLGVIATPLSRTSAVVRGSSSRVCQHKRGACDTDVVGVAATANGRHALGSAAMEVGNT